MTTRSHDTAAVPLGSSPPSRSSAVHQFSTVQALAQGLYHGLTDLSHMMSLGDFGLGTFEHLDGELMVLDGRAYRFDAAGKLTEETDQRLPFFLVSDAPSPPRTPLPRGLDFSGFKTYVQDRGFPLNVPYAVWLRGDFSLLHTRSLPRQHPPYPPLLDVAREQPEFETHSVTADLMGFYLPHYLGSLSVPGFHIHALDQGHTFGGHLLDFRLEEGVWSMEPRPAFQLALPRGCPDFDAMDLDQDFSQEIEEIEGR